LDVTFENLVALGAKCNNTDFIMVLSISSFSAPARGRKKIFVFFAVSCLVYCVLVLAGVSVKVKVMCPGVRLWGKSR
jgi:hypothetical protein